MLFLIKLNSIYFFNLINIANFIKALYFIRKWAFNIPQKPYYFQVVEKSISDLIENEIKNKDKALKYSIRKKDNLEAKAYENFEAYVAIEEIKKFFNQRLQDLIKLKQQYYEKLIEGYPSLSVLYAKQTNLIEKCVIYKNQVRSFYQFHPNSPHLNKLLMIFYVLIFQDLRQALTLDDKLKDFLHQTDYYSSWYTISGLEILKGNVATIIAHFRTKVGRIIKYSASAPQFFGYKKSEFDSLQSLNDIIPQAIGDKHDLFLERFIDEGQSKILRSYRQTLAKNQKGFIFPIKLYINYFFELQNDFIFSSLIVKTPTNSQYILINQHGFIDSFSQNFYEFCSIICPSITVQQLIHSNIFLFMEDLDTHLRDCHLKNKANHNKLVFKLNSKMNDMICKFKNYWKGDKHFNRLMYHIIRVQEEYEDNGDEEDIYQFDIILNLILNQFSLISGEHLTLYILEITSVIPIKNDIGSLQRTNTQFTSHNNKQEAASNLFMPSMTTLINNKISQDNNNQDYIHKNILFEENRKNQDIPPTKQTPNFVFQKDKIEDEDILIPLSKLGTCNQIQSQKSIKSQEEHHKFISNQLDEMDQDIVDMSDTQVHKTNKIPNLGDNNFRFLQQVQQGYKIVESEWLGGEVYQQKNHLDQKLEFIPFTTSQQHLQSINTLNTQNNLTTTQGDNLNQISNLVSPRSNLDKSYFDNSFAHFHKQEDKIVNILFSNDNSMNDSHIVEIDNIHIRSLSDIQYEQKQRDEILQSEQGSSSPKKRQKKPQSSKHNSSANNEQDDDSSDVSPYKGNKISIKNFEMIDLQSINHPKKVYSSKKELLKESSMSVRQDKTTHTTKGTILTKESKQSKKSNKQEIMMKIQRITEKNNEVNIECTLSDENEEDDYIQRDMNQNNNNIDEKYSVQSVGKKDEFLSTSDKSSHLSEVAKRVKNIHRIIYQQKKPKFIILFKLIFLLFFVLLIFAATASQTFSNTYLKQIVDEISVYEIQETILFSFSKSLSAAFGIQNNQNNKGYYLMNLQQSIEKFKETVDLIQNSHISEFDELEDIVISEKTQSTFLRNEISQIYTALFQGVQTSNYENFQNKSEIIFQINSSLNVLSENVQSYLDDKFQTIRQMSLLILILVISLQTIGVLLLIKINFTFRNKIKQYLYISTRINQNEAEVEHIKLSNVLSFLEQSDDQYVKFTLHHSTLMNANYMSNSKKLIIQNAEQGKHNSILYNKIKFKALSFPKLIILVILVAFISKTHQTILFIVTQNQLSNIELPLEQFKIYTQKISDLSTLNAAHQLMHYQQELDYQQVSKQYFNNNIQKLKNFYLEEFQIIPVKGQQYYYSPKIQSLNEQNSCLIYEVTSPQYTYCNQIKNGALTEGLLRGLRELFLNYEDTSDKMDENTFEYADLDYSKEYVRMSTELIESDNKQQKTVLIIAGYTLIIFAYVILIAYLIYKMAYDIDIIKQSIHFIPNKRLIEDSSTLQLIKALQN